MTCNTIELRRGDDLLYKMSFSEGGVPKSMVGWTVSALTMDSSKVKTPLVVSWADQSAGDAVLSLDEVASAALKLGLHSVRVRVQSPTGDTTSSRVVPMEVTE